MSLLDVIGDFATGTYTVTRRAAGVPVAGRVTPGAATTFDVVMSVQPTGARDQVVMPEGLHYEDAVVCYSATELKGATYGTGQGDEFTFGGDTYRVFAVEGPWTMDGDTHWVCRAARRRVP